MKAATPGQAGPLHFTYDGCMALQCFADNPEAEFGETVAFVDPGDSMDFLAGKIREHQAEHGCAKQEPKGAPGSLPCTVCEETGGPHDVPWPEPKAAPELGTAVTETRALRALVAEILDAFGPSGSGHTARVGQVQIARWRTRAGLTK